jgi:hypothetical protein
MQSGQFALPFLFLVFLFPQIFVKWSLLHLLVIGFFGFSKPSLLIPESLKQFCTRHQISEQIFPN